MLPRGSSWQLRIGAGVRTGKRCREEPFMQQVAYLALARAIELVGRAGVCQSLEVSDASIDLWLCKKVTIPGHVFSALVDLLIAQGSPPPPPQPY